MWRSRWNVHWQGKPKFSEKTYLSATFVHHKIPHDKTRVWTRAAAVGSWRLTAWVVKYLINQLIYQIIRWLTKHANYISLIVELQFQNRKYQPALLNKISKLFYPLSSPHPHVSLRYVLILFSCVFVLPHNRFQRTFLAKFCCHLSLHFVQHQYPARVTYLYGCVYTLACFNLETAENIMNRCDISLK
jgi:hypothetical protein